jgi:myxalamid-type polyketide synthase MxaE and MxaD
MACRFPGGIHTPEAFWRLLTEGRETVGEVPADRWNIDEYYDPDPSKPGKMTTRHGNFLDRIDGFDASFFGLAPREVARMDPQQRMLLEVTWEALERAGVPESRFSGTETGVFAGISGTDYWWLQVGDVDHFDGHAGMGGAHCIATGRVSFLLNLRGPNMAIDTACSSSLVAVHLAAQSLRTGECDVAVAGGVNAVISPVGTVFLSKWGVLAPDGRCKPFDASADGFGRGEGCGMVVLKRLSDAQRDGDTIHAVIRGSATNQDGHGTRLSAPNGPSQQAVIRRAISNASLKPEQISFVEAHGTGTRIGDPIEVDALRKELSGSSSGACAIGSVKANLGHLESAAGIAGLMKTVLCLKHGTIPRQIHYERTNPDIDLEGSRLYIPTENTPWQPIDGGRFAGVSSFGLSGSNAHVILGEAPPSLQPARPSTPSDDTVLVPVSARSHAALADVARLYKDWIDQNASDPHCLQDLATTAGFHRTHHTYRAAIVVRTPEECAERLAAIAQGEAKDGEPCFPGDEPKLVFVFSGQGSQWTGMGRELFETEPVFREVIERCDEILRREAPWSLIEVLFDEDGSRLARTEFAQAGIFAVQAGLFALYRSYGIQPEAVVGHSSGEMAAAYASGVLTLEDALHVAYHRGRLMQSTAGQGRMAAVALTHDEAERLVADSAGRLSVAAVNGPESCVISGEPEALTACLRSLEQRGVGTQDLGVDFAFHSVQMDPILDELGTTLAGLQTQPQQVPIVSTVTGAHLAEGDYGAAYWTRNVRQPVRFADAIRCVADPDRTVFLEIGPRPVLRSPITQSLDGREVVALASLRQGQGERTAVLRSLGGLYGSGYEMRWGEVCPEEGRRVDLPTYPWQHRRFWIEVDEAPKTTPKPAPALAPAPVAVEVIAPTNGSNGTNGLNGPNSSNDTRGSAGTNGTNKAHGVDSMNGANGTNGSSGTNSTNSTNSMNGNKGTSGDGDVSGYYDRVSEVDQVGTFLTFAPFKEPVPGFSWLLTFHDPAGRQEHVDIMLEAQRELREVLFRGIDFKAVRSVLDFGCGYGSDVMSLAERNDHLKLDGCTISAGQARVGNAEIKERGLSDRVQIYNKDSSEGDFPGQYDLVFGFEVAHYIRDKHKLFANIDRHLSDGGFVVMADFIANTVSRIDHDQTNSFIITAEEWVELLSTYKLRVVDCVDVSLEISHFLHDPKMNENLDYLSKMLGDQGEIKEHFGSYNGLGQLFAKRLAIYGLFSIQKDPYSSIEEITRSNRERLTKLVPYTEALTRDGLQTPEVTVSAAAAAPDFSSWLYELDWQKADLAQGAEGTNNGTLRASWLIFTDEGGVGQSLAGLLEARGERCVVVSRGEAFGRSRAGHYQVNPARPEDFRQLLAEAQDAEGAGFHGAIYLWALDATASAKTTLKTLSADQELCSSGALHLAQALATGGGSALWIATRGSQNVDEAAPGSFVQSALWGLGRTLAVETPKLWGGLFDLDPRAGGREAAAKIADELQAAQEEDHVAWRGDDRFVARLAARPDARPAADPVVFEADASYLITGGLGGLGKQVAAWMVDSGARDIVLLQRTGRDNLTPEQSTGVREIEALGARVHVVAADVSQEDQVARAIAEIRTLPPLRGVVHAAGVLDDGLLDQLTPERFERVLGPKLMGAWNLHRHTLGEPLDFFVLFSSAAGLLGSPGQANYSAANAALDAFAHYRQQLGLPALSIGWGPWSEVGMAAAQANRGQRVADLGIVGIAPDRGVKILDHLLRQDRAHVGVVSLDMSKLSQTMPQVADLPLLSNLTGRPVGAATVRATPPVREAAPAPAAAAAPAAPAAPAMDPSAASTDVLSQLMAAPADKQSALLKEYLIEQTAKVLHLSASELEFRRPLNSCGIDSLMAVELRNRIESDLKVNLEFVSLLQGASLSELAATVEEQLSTVVPGSDPSRVADVMRQIDGMSDDDVKALLADKKRAR